MKHARILSSVFVFLVLSLAAASPLSAHPGKGVRTLPAPGRFCTGAAFDGKALWVADYKEDRLFCIDPESGKVSASIPSPGFWPAGLAWDGKFLWCGDTGRKKIFKVDPESGVVLAVLDAPTDRPDGLAWDGETLWVCDARAKKIMRIDLSDGTAVRTFPAPARSADGLCFDGKYLWCSDRTSDEIYMIDPEQGEVLIILHAPGPYARGLAWDGECLWNVDYQEHRLHRLVRSDEEPYLLEDTRRARITLTHEVKVYGKGKLRRLDVYLAVPGDMPQQKILSVKAEGGDGAVRSEHEDRWGQKVTAFHYEDVPSESVIETVQVVEADISSVRYFIFPDRCGTLDDIPAEIRERFTADGSKYRTRDPYIRKLAAKLKGDETNPYWIARRIFDHVRETIEYKMEGGWNAAPVVLKRGTGSCSEYSFSFIALCRAAGVPARYVGALVVRGDDASLDEYFHRWPEVYLPNYGWIPMDPQGGDKPLPRDRAAAIGNLSNRFLITTRGGGGSKYLGWYYNLFETYESDPQVQVNIEAFAEWEPR